jgi:hypothetical protein
VLVLPESVTVNPELMVDDPVPDPLYAKSPVTINDPLDTGVIEPGCNVAAGDPPPVVPLVAAVQGEEVKPLNDAT